MKYPIKEVIIFFIAILLFGMTVDYLWSIFKDIEFVFPGRTILVYAIISIIYGYWIRRKNVKKNSGDNTDIDSK